MTRKLLLGPAAAAVCSFCVAWCCFALRTNALVAVLFLLLEIVLLGAYASRAAAFSASVAAGLCLDYYFIPPIRQISIADTQGWLALAVFLIVAFVATNLSTRLRSERDEIARRQSEAEKMHALNRAILLSAGGDDVPRTLLNKSIELFGFDEAALFDCATGKVQSSENKGSISEDELRHVAYYGSVEVNGRRTGIPISLGNKIYGSFVFVGDPLPVGLVQALANTMALSFAQAQTQEAASRTEAVRRSEELKSVIIDALAHELKTPLTSIEAAAGVLENPNISPAQRAELLDVVQQEAKRLQQLMGEAIHLARIDAKRFKLERQAAPVAELIQAALSSLGPRSASHPIQVSIADASIPAIWGDPELIREILKQLLDNALKYSTVGKPIAVSVADENGWVKIAVRDEGPGLTELEQSRVFEKFYRARRDRDGVQGTGMGLAIAREIAEAHGGSVQVESRLGQGSLFTVTLPAAPERISA